MIEIHGVSLLQVARSLVPKASLTREARISLWDGLDRAGEDQLARNHEERHDLARKYANETLIVLGSFDTGTNLLIDQLSSNYPRLMDNICKPWEDHIANCGQVWKHGVEDLYGLLDIIANKGISKPKVIIMVRSPLALLASWKKAPYDLGQCMQLPTWSQMATSTCIADIGWTASGDFGINMQFHGIMDIYNHYMRQYHNITYHSGLIIQMVTYEDLVYSPEMVMKTVATRFGWTVHDDAIMIEDPAKDHGDAIGREEALAKLRSRSFLAEFTDEEKQLLCSDLDEAPLQGITEGTWLDAPRPYSMDCHTA